MPARKKSRCYFILHSGSETPGNLPSSLWFIISMSVDYARTPGAANNDNSSAATAGKHPERMNSQYRGVRSPNKTRHNS